MTESLEREIRTLRSRFWSEHDPDGRAFAPLADAYRRAGDIRQALELLNDGLERHPDFATGHVVAARLYLEKGLVEEARLAASRALELDEENVDALGSLASAQESLGDAEGAEASRRRLADLDPLAAVAAEPVEEEVAEPAAVDEAPDTEDPVFDTAALAPEETFVEVPVAEEPEPEEAALEMDALAPDAPAEEVVSLDDLAPAAEEAAPEEAALEMDTLAPKPEPEEAALEMDALAPDAPDEEVVSLDDLAPATEEAAEPESEEAPLEMDALAPDEEVVSLDDLAPATEEAAEPEPEEAALEMDALAPEPEPEEAPLEMDALAPEPEPEEAALEMDALAPDEEVVSLDDLAPVAEEAAPEPEPEEAPLEMDALAPDEEVVSLDDLAPAAEEAAEPEPEEAALEMDALAPEPEPEEAPLDMDALAPEPDEEVASLDDLAPAAEEAAPEPEPEEVPLEMDALAPEDAEAPDEPAEEPLPTLTLADLYASQGLDEKAVGVVQALLEERPDDPELLARLAELETAGESADSEDVDLAPAEVHEDDPVAASAWDTGAHAEAHDVPTPFAWTEEDGEPGEDAADPPIGDYFSRLLEWRPEASEAEGPGDGSA